MSQQPWRGSSWLEFGIGRKATSTRPVLITEVHLTKHSFGKASESRLNVPIRSPELTDPIGIMLRPGPAGILARSSLRFISSSNRPTSSLALITTHRASKSHALRFYQPRSIALALPKSLYTPLHRYASTQPGDSIGQLSKAEEKAIGKERLQAHPAEVTAVSTAHPVFEEAKSQEPEEEDIDMFAGVKSDFVRRWISILSLKTLLIHWSSSESHSRHICVWTGSTRCFGNGPGWSRTLRCDFTYYALSSLGCEPLWTLGVRSNCRALITYHRTASNWLWRCCELQPARRSN